MSEYDGKQVREIANPANVYTAADVDGEFGPSVELSHEVEVDGETAQEVVLTANVDAFREWGLYEIVE